MCKVLRCWYYTPPPPTIRSPAGHPWLVVVVVLNPGRKDYPLRLFRNFYLLLFIYFSLIIYHTQTFDYISFYIDVDDVFL